jgi:hypothetical protein
MEECPHRWRKKYGRPTRIKREAKRFAKPPGHEFLFARGSGLAKLENDGIVRFPARIFLARNFRHFRDW